MARRYPCERIDFEEMRRGDDLRHLLESRRGDEVAKRAYRGRDRRGSRGPHMPLLPGDRFRRSRSRRSRSPFRGMQGSPSPPPRSPCSRYDLWTDRQGNRSGSSRERISPDTLRRHSGLENRPRRHRSRSPPPRSPCITGRRSWSRSPLPGSPFASRRGRFSRSPVPGSPFASRRGRFSRSPVPGSPCASRRGRFSRSPVPGSPLGGKRGRFSRSPAPGSPLGSGRGRCSYSPVSGSPLGSRRERFSPSPVSESSLGSKRGRFSRSPVPGSPPGSRRRNDNHSSLQRWQLSRDTFDATPRKTPDSVSLSQERTHHRRDSRRLYNGGQSTEKLSIDGPTPVGTRESQLLRSSSLSSNESAPPASPLPLAEYIEQEKARQRQEDEDKLHEKAIAASMEELEEVDEIKLPEPQQQDLLVEADRVSLSSLPSVEECDSEDKEHKNDPRSMEDDFSSVGSSDDGAFNLSPISNDNLDLTDENHQSNTTKKRRQNYEEMPGSSGAGNQDKVPNIILDQRSQGPPFRDPKASKNCLICNSCYHIAKNCPDLMCYRCQLPGHFAKECRNPPAPKPKPPGSSSAATTERGPQFTPSSDPVGLSASYEKSFSDHSVRRYSSAEITPSTSRIHHYYENPLVVPCCRNCKQTGHHTQNCPAMYVTRRRGECGEKRYSPGNCPSPAPSIPQPPKISSFESSFSFTCSSMISKQMENHHAVVETSPWESVPSKLEQDKEPIKSLRTHFLETVERGGYNRKASEEIAEEMVLTWRLCGHNEETLKAVFKRESPCTKPRLRLALVQELSNVHAARIPAVINVGKLLDETVTYLMTEEDLVVEVEKKEKIAVSKNSRMETLQKALKNVERLERFRQLEQIIMAYVGEDPQARVEYEGRLLTLEPVRSFVAEKLRKLSDSLGVSEAFVQSVSGTIQKLMAHVKLCLFTLERMLSGYGSGYVDEVVSEKLLPYADSFPAGVTVKIVVNMICQFLEDATVRAK